LKAKENSSVAHRDPFYTVTQLAAELGITVRTLHFYETQGLITPRRAGTTRVYTQRDRARMILILRGKRLGFSIREIREYLELYDVDPTQMEQVKTLLKSVHNRIHRLKEQRIALDETLVELRVIESQAEAALEALKTAPKPAAVTKTEVKPRRAASAAKGIKAVGRST
jgi:DNA-binding transcriptional MerR regulator